MNLRRYANRRAKNNRDRRQKENKKSHAANAGNVKDKGQKGNQLVPASGDLAKGTPIKAEIIQSPELIPVLSTARSKEAQQRLEPLEFAPIACDSCPISQMCPQFKAGSSCAYEQTFEYQLESVNDLLNLQREILLTEIRRTKFALLQERTQGGVLNEGLSLRMDALFEKAECLRQSIIEEHENKPPEASGNTIIQQIFGDMIVNNG